MTDQQQTDLQTLEQYARKMFELTGLWGVFLDYEYNTSQERYLNPVCCSIAHYSAEIDAYVLHEYWLLNSTPGQATLLELMDHLQSSGHVMIAYSVGAEGRGTMALQDFAGNRFDIKTIQWIDLYLEWLQIKNKNNDMLYGKYLNRGYRAYSVPPSFDVEKNKGKDNTKVGNSLAACVYKVTGDVIDTSHKDAMRDLILENKPVYTPEEQTQIMTYCSSDIKFLAQIWHFATLHLKTKIKQPIKKIVEYQLYRGNFGASGALMESVGLPVHVDKLRNLRNNFDSAADTIIQDLVDNHYPFFVREKKNAGQHRGQWVDKYVNFVEFIKSVGLYDGWPRTYNKEKKKFTDTLKTDNDTLKKFDNVPALKSYRYVKKNLKQLGWLRKPHTPTQIAAGDFFDSVGSDGRLRTFLGLYGTQTARNAPKAKRFILAMSSWLRCTIEPPEGYCIIAVDYASQEFAIAAIRAQDRTMIDAYVSGDPYIFFAKKYGSIAKEAHNIWIKAPHKAPEAEQDKYKKFKSARTLAKGVVLGLQFGLGYKNLAVQLTANTGVVVTEKQALELVDFHKKLFAKYWAWQEVQYSLYLRQGYLQLPNGWALLGDNDNSLSVKNFGVQGMGACIMQDAVLMMHELYNAKIITPLHDAVYTLVPEAQVDQWKQVICYCMDQAVYKNLGDKVKIRLDVDVHRKGEPWVEEKGEQDYKMLKKYLSAGETSTDRFELLTNTLYKRIS